METVNLFGTRRGRLTQAAVWSMERERFSAQALAGALEVSIPTAISLLRRLEEAGLASACGAFHSTGGRRPRAWSARPSARFAVGVDVTRRQVTLVAADLAGHVLRTRTHALPFSRAARRWAWGFPFPASSAGTGTLCCARTRCPCGRCAWRRWCPT